jgi:hypothetical protein
MSRPWWNPKQSDYAGRYRLAAYALGAALAMLFLGFNTGLEILQTLLVSGGVGLLIGSGAVALGTWRSWRRKNMMDDD